MNFSARSPSERQLDRIHDSDESAITGEDVTEQRIAVERALARLIADHPSISMSSAEVLECSEYDLDELRASAAELFPNYTIRT